VSLLLPVESCESTLNARSVHCYAAVKLGQDKQKWRFDEKLSFKNHAEKGRKV
jgi:hypothetical protein